jgi:outer membrane protein assembly factor BamB
MWVYRYGVVLVLALLLAGLNICVVAHDWPNSQDPHSEAVLYEVNAIGAGPEQEPNTVEEQQGVVHDWPNWRGPDHNGISYEVNGVGDWPECEPNIIWEQQVGTGFSSIVVVDGRLFTMGNTGSKGDGLEHEHQDVLHCLDPSTGAVLWTHAYASALNADGYHEGGPTATPTVVDANVYTLSKHGLALCLDANDGAILWQTDLVQAYGVKPPMWDFAGSPYVDANRVIYNAGTHGLALNIANGSLAWETGTERAGYSTPVPFDLGPTHMLALMGRRTFAVVEALTGQTVWEHPWVTPSDENISDLIIDGNMLFVSTQRTGSALFEMHADGLIEIWAHQDMQSFLNSAVLWQGYLYGPNEKNKKLTCVEFATGRIMWSETTLGRGSVMMADEKLIMLSDQGRLTIAEVAHDHYQELGTGQILTGKCWTVPTLAHGKIYARNAVGNLVCVELVPVVPDPGRGR